MSSRPPTPRLEQRRVAFQGRVFWVERDHVRLPDGRPKIMDIVRHRGSVVLLPQPSAGEVILIRQYRYVISRWIWEVPAGSLEAGERPASAARRECAEEIGLVPRTVRRLAMFYPTPGFCDERMIFYQCTGLRRPAQPVPGDDDEQIEPRTMTLAEAWRLVARGEIIDMKTVLGLVLLESEWPSTRTEASRPGKRVRQRRA